MDPKILLSKVVATPTETGWSQVYSTLNLYIVLSIKSENPKENIVSSGKELLEKLQREYFSQDQKNLNNIKKSVENALSDLDPEFSSSIVLATITENILYIVISQSGLVTLKRNGKIGTVATGEEGVVAFSGELKGDDIVILETGDFSQKIPQEKLSEVLDHLNVNEISENLAPLIHEDSQGTEGAIILQYKDPDTKVMAEEEGEGKEDENKEEDTDTLDLDDEPKEKKIKIPNVSLAFLNKFNLKDKKIVIFAIILLVFLLFGNIYLEKARQESAKRAQALAAILTPAQKKYDDTNSLSSLNKGIALDQFTQLKSALDGDLVQFKQGTTERKKLEEFIGKVESKIGELGSASTVSNQKVLFDASKNSIKEIALVQYKNNSLIVGNQSTGKILGLSSDGKPGKEMDSSNKNLASLAMDNSFIYALGDAGISKLDRSSGKSSVAVKDASGDISIDTFLGNIYGLNSKDKIIDKFQTPSFSQKNYIADDTKLSNPQSFSIDSSIWVLDGGKIRKFTKGKEVSFTANGLSKIGESSLLFTSEDFSNIYVLDKSNSKIISISKDGEVKNTYSWHDLTNASSVAVDEKGSKVFVVIENKLYSFDL